MKPNVEGDEDETHGYGFLESVERPKLGNTYSRTNLVFDVVDARWFETGDIEARTADKLGIVRVISTERRLRTRFKLETQDIEGHWYKFTLRKQRNRPLAWVLNGANYSGAAVRTSLIGLEKLDKTTRGIFNPGKAVLAELTRWCALERATESATTLEPRQPGNIRVRVLDVGQANCAAIHSTTKDGKTSILGYFDVGGPAFFHHKSFPKPFSEKSSVPTSGFVALSHWDFDHYSLALTALPELQTLEWYAPNQVVGPTAARLQMLLGARLHLISAPTFKLANGLVLWRGTGDVTNRNDSGYVLTAMASAGRVLVAGDVAYGSIPSAAFANLAALGVTHHGGKGCANPPPPNKNGRVAAISYGLGNRYGHPISAHVDAHSIINWDVKHTAEFATTPRGDIWLP